MQWFGTERATSHYLIKWWFVSLIRMCSSVVHCVNYFGHPCNKLYTFACQMSHLSSAWSSICIVTLSMSRWCQCLNAKSKIRTMRKQPVGELINSCVYRSIWYVVHTCVYRSIWDVGLKRQLISTTRRNTWIRISRKKICRKYAVKPTINTNRHWRLQLAIIRK